MGMYTELEYNLTLKTDNHIEDLLNWLKDPYVSDDSYNYKDFPVHFKHYKFFALGRKSWFSDLSYDIQGDEIILKGCANLKDYESQTLNLLEMLKPNILSGSYKTLYEEDLYWEEWIDE